MKLIHTLAFLFCFLSSFSQWTRVEQLPSSDISSLYHTDSALYAGGKSIVYFSADKGHTWDSTNIIPSSSFVDNIIVYKNELYATSFSKGVYKSTDGGNSWQNITTGILPELSDLVEWRGDLYAATLGSSIIKLDPVHRDKWLNFSNGLGNISANATSIAATSNTLVAGTLNNALYDYLPANATTWEERFLLNQLRPTEGVYDIINGHDSLFLAGHTGRCYVSTDNGLNWNTFGNILTSLSSSLANAKQALLLARSIFDGVRFNTSFSYIKKDSLQEQFVPFSFAPDNFAYKIDILGDKLWEASDKGLFFMSLSTLPGISSADDPATITTLPVRFTFFNTNCEERRVLLTWKTVQEQNSHHYDIERSTDNIHWTVIGTLPATSNNSIENSYSFADNNPVQNSYYHIAQTDKDGKVVYTNALRPVCNTTDAISVWPNPVLSAANINIVASNGSVATVRIFDSKGALVRGQKLAVSQGSNRFSVDIKSLAAGIYSLSVEWNNGQIKKTVQVVRQ